jgi:hypothetical protein
VNSGIDISPPVPGITRTVSGAFAHVATNTVHLATAGST